jgi:acetyl esterase/lipase
MRPGADVGKGGPGCRDGPGAAPRGSVTVTGTGMDAMRKLLAALLVCGMPAMAQPTPDLAAGIERIGRVIAPAPTAALYAPLHAPAPWPGVTVTRDARYGEDARHRLDVFAPAERPAAPLPVLVFVHGGGFVAGDKQGPDGSPFYANIGVWAARNGLVGVNITYRLAPAHPYPAVQQDIAAALAWVSSNIAAHGGDPARVTLAGHSAGAIHAALYAVDPRLHPAGVAPPVGYALVSALFEFGGAEVPPNERAYFGTQGGALSPLPALARVQQPIFLAHGTLDPERFVAQSLKAAATLRDAGRPHAATLQGHSHMSEVHAIGTADTSLTAPLLAFIRR